MTELPAGFRAYLTESGADLSQMSGECGQVYSLPTALEHLSDGDIVRISPQVGDIWVMYRRRSPSNSLLLTEQCNSNCVMCSQPPKVEPDDHLLAAYLDAVPLMDPDTPELGLTGGEPTLLGPRLLHLIRCCKSYLPRTGLHLLSNGRLFSYLSFCKAFAEVGHPDVMVGIPLYSDLASLHDFVVQAAGAFDQTIRGIMGLERVGIPVEIRVVLHRQTIDRLPQLARFIGRNLPFAAHVALMGLEPMGYVRMNLEALWIDPWEYQPQLRTAVEHLASRGITVSIYNHQLCILDQSLWPYARKSISDWKNDYVECCSECTVQNECGGFFSSSLKVRRSSHIAPVATGVEAGAVPVSGSFLN